MILVWDLSTLTKDSKPTSKLQGHQSFVTYCDYEPSKQLVASSSLDCTVRIWHPNVEGELFSLKCNKGVHCSVFVRTHLMLTCAENGVFLWDLRKADSPMECETTREEKVWSEEQPKSVSLFNWTDNVINNKQINKDENLVPVAQLIEKNLNKTKIFSSFKKRYERPFYGYKDTEFAYSAVFTSDGNHILTTATTLKLWDFRVFKVSEKCRFLKGFKGCLYI